MAIQSKAHGRVNNMMNKTLQELVLCSRVIHTDCLHSRSLSRTIHVIQSNAYMQSVFITQHPWHQTRPICILTLKFEEQKMQWPNVMIKVSSSCPGKKIPESSSSSHGLLEMKTSYPATWTWQDTPIVKSIKKEAGVWTLKKKKNWSLWPVVSTDHKSGGTKGEGPPSRAVMQQ